MKRFCVSRLGGITLVLAFLLGALPTLNGYSVLSHEAVIDALWDTSIQKLLLKRFPNATPDQLREAHAYAYGGCIIQDMGYYPFGSIFFSDLLHYVRSGDFIESLFRQAQDLDEYAFAIGALSHYSADNIGHPMAVNRSVALLYPKLRAKYGDVVTYADDRRSHLLVEFGFDVVQVAAGLYAPDNYRDFIGFQVSKPLLERAFKETYGLDIRDVLFNEDLALSTYRRGAGKTIPHLTKVAWELRRDQIEKLTPGITRRKFVYRLSRREYEKEYGKNYRGRRVSERVGYYKQGIAAAAHTPGFGAKILAIIFTIIPRFGPFHAFSFKPATPETERMFLASLNATRENYQRLLEGVDANRLHLSDEDFDTGKATRAGEYPLADRTYTSLLARLQKDHFKNVTLELRANIVSFFEHFDAVQATKQCKDCRNIPLELEELKAAPVQSASAAAPVLPSNAPAPHLVDEKKPDSGRPPKPEAEPPGLPESR